MLVTVVPGSSCASVLWKRGIPLYWMAVRWLNWAIGGARVLLGIRARVTGMENLPTDKLAGAVLLVKHQSTYETFLMPTLMPHPLAFVFKKELIYVPFFGWAMARLDMIHIDRSQPQAFTAWRRGASCSNKASDLFPEAIPRGQKATTRARSRDRAGGADRGDPPVWPAASSSARRPMSSAMSVGRKPELMREVEADRRCAGSIPKPTRRGSRRASTTAA